MVTSTSTPPPEPVDEQLDFLQLLAKDLPTGYATYCHEHRILHIRQPKAALLERVKFWKKVAPCEQYYQLPLGTKGRLSVVAVQDAARGVVDFERLTHYERLKNVTALHSSCCIRGIPPVLDPRWTGYKGDRYAQI